MLQNPRKTLGYTKNMVYKIPPGGGGKPYPASGLLTKNSLARTEILYMTSYKWRSIALILIMHVYICMQIQIVLGNIITKTFLVHLYICVAVFS